MAPTWSLLFFALSSKRIHCQIAHIITHSKSKLFVDTHVHGACLRLLFVFVIFTFYRSRSFSPLILTYRFIVVFILFLSLHALGTTITFTPYHRINQIVCRLSPYRRTDVTCCCFCLLWLPFWSPSRVNVVVVVVASIVFPWSNSLMSTRWLCRGRSCTRTPTSYSSTCKSCSSSKVLTAASTRQPPTTRRCLPSKSTRRLAHRSRPCKFLFLFFHHIFLFSLSYRIFINGQLFFFIAPTHECVVCFSSIWGIWILFIIEWF